MQFIKKKIQQIYEYLIRPIEINFFHKRFKFNIISLSEEGIKKHCLNKLITIWKDPKQNRSKTSSIALAIEGSDILLPYLEYKYPNTSNINWSEYFEECTNMRLYLLNELIKMGHAKYINNVNRYGNSPLIFSCALKEPRLVQFLLNNGATITQPFRCNQCSCIYSHHYEENNNQQQSLSSVSIEGICSQFCFIFLLFYEFANCKNKFNVCR